jgi:uncharacterized membrane protein YcaP (DUF421 family)
MDFIEWDWPAYGKWLWVSEPAVVAIAFTALGIYLAVILLTRLQGLRTFSKMSSFDFAITVAIGSVIASTVVLESVSLMKGAVALAALYTVQFTAATLRQRFDWFGHVQDNEALLLMAGSRVLDANLREAQMTRRDLRSKLREANVIHEGQVRAVVMETTGDVSVLHTAPDGPDLDPALLSGVRDADHLREQENVATGEGENADRGL